MSRTTIQHKPGIMTLFQDDFIGIKHLCLIITVDISKIFPHLMYWLNRNYYSYVFLFPATMPRSGGTRRYLKEIAESPRAEKMAFIPPFVILITESVLLVHAIQLAEPMVIMLTGLLLFVSIIELFLILREMHLHRMQTTFERELTIRLDDFIIERHMGNVSNIVTLFLQEYEEYKASRTTIYHIACQIMETHKKELWEKTLRTRLKRHITKTKKKALRDIIDSFVKKFPEYQKDPAKVYQLAATYLSKKDTDN